MHSTYHGIGSRSDLRLLGVDVEVDDLRTEMGSTVRLAISPYHKLAAGSDLLQKLEASSEYVAE
ncbi:hypothetical protein PV11_01847 [Exophiala sideris]|uniref:Uncharacterized protein n=1 Tax=Exophiala sideris TaxID=1016849 RepID=A0A0D1WBV1_9EURO|nr:hypothetical protein PV11_01847 [Exophiala sideris]